MKVIAIIFAVLICIYAVVSLVSLVLKFVNNKKKRTEIVQHIEDQDGAEVSEQSDTGATD